MDTRGKNRTRAGLTSVEQVLPMKETSASSPGPATISSTKPEKGFFHPGLLIHDVTNPPPRIILKWGRSLLKETDHGKGAEGLTQVVEGKPDRARLFIFQGLELFSKALEEGFLSGSSAARRRSLLLRGDSVLSA